MNTANLENLIKLATENDIANAAAQATRNDPMMALAYVIIGLVAVVGAFTWAGLRAAR
ncbi:hypothetical protein D3C83_167970 [compost metagenome]